MMISVKCMWCIACKMWMVASWVVRLFRCMSRWYFVAVSMKVVHVRVLKKKMYSRVHDERVGVHGEVHVQVGAVWRTSDQVLLAQGCQQGVLHGDVIMGPANESAQTKVQVRPFWSCSGSLPCIDGRKMRREEQA
jgi:hypothetical protein